MNEEIRSGDLFEGAYLLCSGCCLKELSVCERGQRPRVEFVIGGQNVGAKAAAYRTGEAIVNASRFGQAVGKLKDAMFAALRADCGKRVER